MANSRYKYNIITIWMLVLVICVSSCSSNPHMINTEVFSKDELSSNHFEELKCPRGMVLPITNDFWYIPPFVHNIRQKDAQIDLQPPRQMFTSTHNTNMHLFGNIGTWVINDFLGSSSWLNIVDIIKKSHFAIVYRQDNRQTLYTDWIYWSRKEDTPYLGRYKISVHRHDYQDILTVTLVLLRKKENLVYDSSTVQQYTAKMLQYLSSKLASYSAHQPTSSRISRSSYKDLIYVTNSTDYAGFPNLILHAPFNYAWKWLPQTLTGLGMEIKECNYTQGRLMVKYNSRNQRGVHKAGNKDLYLKNGNYKIQVGDLGTHSSLQFFNVEGYPLSRCQNEALVSLFNRYV
ncbi:Outer membrane protein assembly factor BamC [Candidatus Erwinia haradaeae]|uniref:Outer membrane protein assembly factor BamC n=1 Tax=Candidatus Erwinia haradaeae TaxID=1922217 RepID=A0A451DC16_9GAMM|nr:outer membrane protein assembly factor BamC [Candidatus Erwinia haradaeae]VFP83943.1 Outer membrane protein assembly factor BamC [Candidatus Erwinia haradaeae]